MRKRGFEICNEFKSQNINLPIRKTMHSVGYDIEAADTVTIPSIWKTIFSNLRNRSWCMDFSDMRQLRFCLKYSFTCKESQTVQSVRPQFSIPRIISQVQPRYPQPCPFLLP